ncbi:hypothetical protein KR032_007580, partial [Drosophila birchii]
FKMFGYSSILIFFLSLTALHAAPPPAKFQPIGSRFFYIENNATSNWREAARICLRMGGELATIRSPQELNLIVPKLEWNSKYWLSLNDLAREGMFVPLASDQPAPFLNWKEGQPDNYNNIENCVLLINYYIYDSACNNKAHYICE